MASPNVVELTTDNWQTEVVGHDGAVLVDFWAPWCGPCRALSPVIDRLADRYAGKVKVGKVNVDENQDLAVKYNIMTIPRLLIFKGSDRPIKEIAHAANETDLARELDQASAEA